MTYFKTLVAIGLLSTAGLPALAQEAGPKAPLTSSLSTMNASSHSWSGAYVGGSLVHNKGGKVTHESENAPLTPGGLFVLPADFSKRASSKMSGAVFAGYNWEHDGIVYGVEGSVSSKSKSVPVDAATFQRGVRTDLRVRIGKSFDNTLFYAAVGGATEKVKLSYSNTTQSKTMSGWTVAIGADYAFTSNWFGRFEVNYTDYGSKNFDQLMDTTKLSLKETRVNLGIAYKF